MTEFQGWDTGSGSGVVPTTEEVVERFKDMVYAICLTHTSCRADADDVFQEVFLTYHRKQPECNDDEHRKAWLITTTLMVARRVAASSYRLRVVPTDPSDFGAGSAVFSFPEPQHNELFDALGRLPETYRSVIHLFYFEDLPVARIASILELDEGAVKMRLSRGRGMLRKIMTGEGDDV